MMADAGRSQGPFSVLLSAAGGQAFLYDMEVWNSHAFFLDPRGLPPTPPSFEHQPMAAGGGMCSILPSIDREIHVKSLSSGP